MKELSIKEKAKRYDKAEIKESEDEMIREELLNAFQESEDSLYMVLSPQRRKSFIAWLEKQGEKNEIDYDEEIKKCKANPLYFFDKYVKVKLKKQNPDWSKEDENNILFLTSIIEECFKDKESITLYGDTNCANFTKENVINRLKSLRPQNTWKPSESDILLLEKIANGKSNPQDFQASLWGLIGQLKKLRE